VSAGKSLTTNDPATANASTLRCRGEGKRKESPEAPKEAEPEGFAEFRVAYPKRNTAFPTTQARKRWLEAMKRGAEPAEIVAGAKAYAAEQARIGKVGTEFVQTADVWLNRQRWRDYIEAELPPKPPAAVPDETWCERMLSCRVRGGYWPWQPCLPPDDPRMAVPRHILDEFGIDTVRAGIIATLSTPRD
jgi:hypothetical protein